MTSKLAAGTACIEFVADMKSFDRALKSLDGQLGQQANALGQTFKRNYLAGANFSEVGKDLSKSLSQSFLGNKSAGKSGKQGGDSFAAAFRKQVKGKLAGGAATLAISAPVIAAEAR